MVRQHRVNFAQLVGQRSELVQHRLKLPLVVGGLRYVGRHHQQAALGHHCLRIVALIEPAAGHRHDARGFVGQIDLIRGQRSFHRRLRRLATGRAASGLGLRFPRCKLCLIFGVVPLEAFLRAGFDLCPCLRKLLQPCLPSRQLLRDRHPVRHVRLIRSFGFGQEFGHLGLQLRLDRARVLIGKRAVPAGVGMDLRPIQRNRAHPQNAHLVRQFQHLDGQRLDLLEEPPAERRDRVVVRVIVRGDEAKRHRIVGGPLQLAAEKHPRRVAIHQDAQQHRGVIGRRTRTAVGTAHRAQVQPVNHFNHEACQVSFRQPFVYRGRHQKAGLPVSRAEVAHARLSSWCESSLRF